MASSLHLWPVGKGARIMNHKEIHVVPVGSKWAVRQEGEERPISMHATQNEAERAGRTLAERDQAELVIHGQDGKIRAKNSYGNDPRSSRG